MFQRPFATRFTCSTFLKCSHQVVIMKGSISWHYPKKSIHVQPLLMTEVEKILSSATACTPIFSIVLSGFQQWRHMHFLFHQLAHGNKFVPACSCSLKKHPAAAPVGQSRMSAFLLCCLPLGLPRLFTWISLCISFSFCNIQEKDKWSTMKQRGLAPRTPTLHSPWPTAFSPAVSLQATEQSEEQKPSYRGTMSRQLIKPV